MEHLEKTVFISYRREASSYVALAISKFLKDNGFRVFVDLESIHAGKFPEQILQAIKASSHFLLILAPGVLDRCIDPNDWVRREIEIAIDSERNIIPIITKGFDLQEAKPFLDGKLKDLVYYQALYLPIEYFEEALNRLKDKFLSKPVEVDISPLSNEEQNILRQISHEIDHKPQPTQNDLLAEQLYTSGFASDTEGQISLQSEAIKLNPKLALAYIRRGLILYELGNIEEAANDFSEAIAIKPDYPESYNYRGNCYADIGEYIAGINDFTFAIKLAPDFSNAYHNRGLAYKLAGDFSKAINDFTTAIKLNPGYARTYYQRASVFLINGEHNLALLDYEEYLNKYGGRRYGDQLEIENLIKEIKKKI